MFQWRTQSPEPLPVQPELSIKFLDSILRAKQNVYTDSILPAGNQHLTFPSDPFNTYKSYEEGCCFLPITSNELHCKPTGKAREAGELHYCEFIKYVNLFMSE